MANRPFRFREREGYNSTQEKEEPWLPWDTVINDRQAAAVVVNDDGRLCGTIWGDDEGKGRHLQAECWGHLRTVLEDDAPASKPQAAAARTMENLCHIA